MVKVQKSNFQCHSKLTYDLWFMVYGPDIWLLQSHTLHKLPMKSGIGPFLLENETICLCQSNELKSDGFFIKLAENTVTGVHIYS